MRRSRAWWALRAGLPLLALALALAAFGAGVGLSQRPGIEQANFITQVYYAVGLFVLGGLDLGLPIGGPSWARLLLWFDYFLAPTITTGVVVEGVLRVLRPQWLLRAGLRRHAIVVGAGRLGVLVMESLRAHNPRLRIVLVDRDTERSNVEHAKSRFGAHFIAGDVRHEATLASLALHRAALIVLATDNDLVNLETAWHVVANERGCRVVAHVADIGMTRAVAHVEAESRVRVFNGHRIAAERLYREHLKAQFAATAESDVVVLAGFGRFGQTILEYLHAEAYDELHEVVVVDVHAERRLRLFRAQVPDCADRPVIAIDGDVDDPRSWSEIDGRLRRSGVPPILVLATDDDAANLRTAVALRGLHPKARIFVRCVYQSAFTTELSQRLGFDVLAVDDMLRHAIGQEQARWLAG